MPITGYKQCATCGEDKPLSDFYRNRRARDGHVGMCKPCWSTRYKRNGSGWKNVQKRPEPTTHRQASKRASRRRYRAKSSREREYMREWRARNAEKDSAHAQVRNAVARGDLIRPEQCEGCSEQTFLHAHHHDYSKPLDVEWLCPKCHRARHT